MPKLRIQTFLGAFFFIVVLITIIAAVKKGAFVDHTRIIPELLRQPRGNSTLEKEFAFSYRNNVYKVIPLSDYEFYGLVVSHNDVNSFTDILRRNKSAGTKDVAVIWGNNLRSNDFHKVEYGNSDTWVDWDCPRGVTFDPKCISNNHLISDNKQMREQISKIHVGDQIYIKGLLVNYQNTNTPKHGQKSYLSRDDAGDGASEVIFVKELEILKAATPGWYKLYDYGWKGIVIIPVIMVIISLVRTFRDVRIFRHKHNHPYPKIPE